MANKLAIKSTKAAVMSLECQLAQVQIKRFLNGDNIPEDLLKELEQHLLSCTDCLAVAKGERAAVEAHMVANAGEAVAVRQSAPASSVFDVFKQPKTVLLSVALGVVLIVMSTVLRDPTKLLGTKAIAAHPEATRTESATQDPEAEDETDTKETQKDVKDPVEPAETKATTPDTTQAEPKKPESTPPVSDEKPRDETAGHTTPPGPAAAAVKAAQQAVEKGKSSVPGKPTLTKSPIVEVTEGKPKASPPKATTRRTTPRKSTTRRTTPRRTTSKPKSGGGVKIYKN